MYVILIFILTILGFYDKNLSLSNCDMSWPEYENDACETVQLHWKVHYI